jgi:cholestenol Delta-isomerase
VFASFYTSQRQRKLIRANASRRLRRVKCDEIKPQCNRCVQSGRTCDGYAAAGLSRRTLAVAVRSISAPGPASRVLAGPQRADDVACFDFFRLRTAPTAGAFFPSDFWSRRILQVTHAEPAVRAAATALGALHRRFETEMAMAAAAAAAAADGEDKGTELCELQERFATLANLGYGEALRLARDIQQPAVLLVLSLALAAVANLAGRWADVRVHMMSGQKLLAQMRAEAAAAGQSAAEDLETDCAAESFVRMDLQGIVFSEATAPYSFFENDLPERGAILPGAAVGSLNQATTRLLDIFSRIVILTGREFDNKGKAVFRNRTAWLRIRDEEITAWENATKSFLERMTSAEEAKLQTGLLSLKLHHSMVRLLVKAEESGPETRWDRCLPHFERVIRLSSTLLRLTQPLSPSVVSVDTGLVMPLFMVSARCRHPGLRRTAITLLRAANRHEGRWISMGGAVVATKIGELEEEGLGIDAPMLRSISPAEAREWAEYFDQEEPRHWLSGDEIWASQSSWQDVPIVPEHQRIADTFAIADADKRTIRLRMIYSDTHGNEPSCAREAAATCTF